MAADSLQPLRPSKHSQPTIFVLLFLQIQYKPTKSITDQLDALPSSDHAISSREEFVPQLSRVRCRGDLLLRDLCDFVRGRQPIPAVVLDSKLETLHYPERERCHAVTYAHCEAWTDSQGECSEVDQVL